MKVLTTLVLALGTVSALGSGPYLPSGWKPKGPAFLLPTEIQKPALQPLILEENQSTSENLAKLEGSQAESAENEDLQESEASGSDFLREYGPPNFDLLKTITEQSLPDVQTERPFAKTETSAEVDTSKKSDQTDFIEVNVSAEPSSESDNAETVKVNEKEDNNAEVTTAKQITPEEEATTESAPKEVSIKNDASGSQVTSDEESQISGVGSLEYLPPSVNEVEDKSEDELLLKAKNSDSTAQVDASPSQYLPTAAKEAEEKIEIATPLFQAKLETESPANASVNVEYFPPINQPEETVDSNDEKSNKVESENELKALDDAVVIEAKLDDQPNEEGSGLQSVSKVDEPVGFREYGPPKDDNTGKKSDAAPIVSNETRKRRFSSKFVAARKH